MIALLPLKVVWGGMGLYDVAVGSTNERDAVGGEAVGGNDFEALDRQLLVLAATESLQGVAAPGQFAATVHEDALSDAMVRAHHLAKTLRSTEKVGYRLGASAAVMLIRDFDLIFPLGGPQPGEPLGEFSYRGYLPGAALSVATSVAECFADVLLPVGNQKEARDHFLDHVNQIIDDRQFTNRNAATSLVECLNEFQPAEALLDEPTGPHHLGGVGADPEPVPPPARRGPRWWHLGVAVVATVVVMALVTGKGRSAKPAANAIPVLPDASRSVSLARTLPNTQVQLFAFPESATVDTKASTAPGLLPNTAAPVMRIKSNLTFQVWLSVRDTNKPPDTLMLSAGAAYPTRVIESHRMLDQDHPGDPEPRLDTHDNDNDNGNVPIPTLAADGSPTIYQFVLTAPPDIRTVGYWCGYNAKPLQILISTTDSEAAWAVTTYPLYVVRDKDC